MLPDSPEPEVGLPVPPQGAKLWRQIVLMLLLAALAQGIGLGFAYVARCKPGQGNDWCGLGSVAGVVIGFGAAVCILVAGTILIVLRRRTRSGTGGGGKVGALRILSVALGVLLVLPCGWMLGFGWIRNKGDLGLWLGVVLGVALIALPFIRRRRG